MTAAATSKGLCYTGTKEHLFEWVKSRRPHSRLVHDDKKLQSFFDQLLDYVNGERQGFTVPLDLHGTEFQLAVWNEVCRIPYGQTRSYSELASRLGGSVAVRLGARAIGAAVGANPVLIVVPCHRVIGKNGSLTGYRGGLKMKERLLRLEGRLGLWTS